MARSKLVYLPIKPKNKEKRQALYLKAKKTKESAKRDIRLRRKREEAKNPQLRVERQQKNEPITIEKKRRWDNVDDADEGGTGIGQAVDVGSLKKRRIDHEMLEGVQERGENDQEEGLTEQKLRENEEHEAQREPPLGSADNLLSLRLPMADKEAGSDADNDNQESRSVSEDSNIESLMNSTSENEDQGDLQSQVSSHNPTAAASTTSSYLSLIPDALANQFPTLFRTPVASPKLLITTSLNSFSIHDSAKLLCDLFPNSTYIPRQRHRWQSHYFSLREISKFASNRDFTALLVLGQELKRPHSLTVIHLPHGPTLSFTLSNWIPGKAIPGHGRPTDHHPELILNNFRTPLGLLTAHSLRALFPNRPELVGRQVATFANQRDFILVRRHRYAFREQSKTGEIKASLQEVGPRFTMKLRRVDKGIQRASEQEWEWKGRMEKQRNRFQL